MNILDRKGYVRVGVGAGFLITIAILVFLVFSLLSPLFPTNGGITGGVVEAAETENGGPSQTVNGGSPPAPNNITDNGTDGNETNETEDGGKFFVFTVTGGGGSQTTCHGCHPKHWVCDYHQRACVQVSGSGENECSSFDDCVHAECDYDDEMCLTVDSKGDDGCSDDEDCFCDPKTPGYWKNHLSEAEDNLGCVHDETDIYDDVLDQDDIDYVLECSGDCSSMFSKLKKFLLATLLNLCAGYFDLDDAHNGTSIEDWVGQAEAEVENGESEGDEAIKDVLDRILNDDIECNPERHTECNYVEMTCDVVTGSGDDECETFEDCEKHTVCDHDEKSCVTVEGPGTNECSDYDDCIHTECCDGYCIDVQGTGGDECESDQDCRHHECNYEKYTCEEIFSVGKDECVIFDDCPQHTVCDYVHQECETVEGPGTDECTTYSDCVHTECNYDSETCETILSPGSDECETFDDCVEECEPPFISVDKEADPEEVTCEETTIRLTVTGDGEECPGAEPVDVVMVFDNSGSMDDDGWDGSISDWQPIGDAKEAAKAFVDLMGSGDRAGLVSFNTIATLQQHLTFDKTAVKSAIGGMSAGGWTNMSQGIDYANQELVSNGRGNVSWVEILLSDGNNNCGSKSPPPDCNQRVYDSAQEAADSGIVIYTIALGSLANQSLMQEIADITGGKSYYAPSSEDLEDIYEEIAGEIVITLAGKNVTVIDFLPDYVILNESTLPAECTYDDIDRKITCDLGTMHLGDVEVIEFSVYVNKTGYVLVDVYPDSGVDYINQSGSGIFLPFPETYVTSNPCDYCGDGTVTPPEECELPGTNNNPFCSQSTTDCLGHKLGVRDAFGNCDAKCGCIDDPFEYSCVEGECGAECDEDTDCPCQPDGCVGPDWYDYPDHGICTDDCICDTGDQPCDGPCKPKITEDDPRCTQLVCDYYQEACILAEGSGDDECETFDDCEKHTVCDHDKQACETVEGAGTDECSSYNDCIHTECDYDKHTCETILSPGSDECETFEDCEKHTVCDHDEKSCVTVEGPGTNECSDYDDCIHTECCDMACVTVQSPGTDECSTDADCIDYVCNYEEFTCDTVPGTGYVECETFEDCPRHTVCNYVDDTCEIVEGPGTNECSTYFDCIHTTCNYDFETCETIDSPGISECVIFEEDCLEHTVCDYDLRRCVMLSGPGDDECITFDDCENHTVCNYCEKICETVSGPGADECTTYDDCTHTVCNYIAKSCDTLNSPGRDECITFDDCEKHNICDYKLHQCITVSGPGTNQCEEWEDCLFCGDGIVTSPEQCEYPGTDNNGNCPQTTTTCSGRKLGVRDSYGYCDMACGCIADPFSYSCVPGQCGAECANDGNCGGDSCSKTYNDYCEKPAQRTSKLVDYNRDGEKNSLTVTDSCDDECQSNCLCADCDADCSPPTPRVKCVKGVCGADCDEPSDCPCPSDGCKGKDWYDYPDYGRCCSVNCWCNTNTGSGGGCEPKITRDDPRCSHSVCDSGMCIRVSGNGGDECSCNDDCVLETHRECSGSACILVLGAGPDTCSSFKDCVVLN